MKTIVTTARADALLREAGWLHSGEKMGTPGDATITGVLYEDLCAEDMAVGCLYAHTDTGQYPLILNERGNVQSFMLRECKAVARCLNLTLKNR
jgi:hypothetical protein